MIIAISGTPGTGKTAVAKILRRKLNANLITISGLIRKGLLSYSYDRKRKTKIIDEKEFAAAVRKAAMHDIDIVESHLAHLIKSDFIFVLRANPAVLEKRMKKKGWPKAKVRENLEAEMIDGITSEAIRKNKSVYEIDASKRTAREAVSVIIKILNNFNYGKKYRAGKIDWTEKYGNILLK